MMDRRQSSLLGDSTFYYHHPPPYHESVASLAYRPLHSPLQQQQQQQQQHQQEQHQQQQHQHQQQQHQQLQGNLLDQHQPSHLFLHLHHDQQQTSSALAYQGPNLHHLHSPFHHQPSEFRQDLTSSYSHQPHQSSPSSANHHRTRAQARRQQHRIMASYDEPVPALSEEELAELQKASAGFEPEVKGPLVSERQSTTAITTEYASADPVYQAKTALLPQKFSHYRTIRGDGACGWRAVAFGYFETLIHHGDSNRFAAEQARLISMNNTMVQAGYNPMLFEDFVDETKDVLRELGDAVSNGLDASQILIEKFNDPQLQMYIITHLRTLTAAWMKTREDEYTPWLIGNTVTQYCDAQILPTYAEIDNIGLSALKDVLLSFAGISLEVMYLDRSEGSEVTMHRFDPADGLPPIGSVRLLYRPGHYDLLYKPEDLPTPPPQPQQIATYLQYGSQTHQEPVYDLGVPDFLTMIPGISYASTSPWGVPSSFGKVTGASNFFANVPPQTCAGPLIPTPSMPTPPQPPHIHPQSNFTATSTPTPLVPPPSQLTHDLPIRNNSHTTLAHSDFQHQLGGGPGGPFRPSFWQFEPDFMQASSCVPYQTAIFRNSHFNTAHFLNPDFQPEQWDPEDEYATSGTSGKSTRSKSGG